MARGLRQHAATIIRGFREGEGISIVNLTPALFDQAFDLYVSRADKEWGLVDCLSFVVMEERGIVDALTNDKHFIQAGFNALLNVSD